MKLMFKKGRRARNTIGVDSQDGYIFFRLRGRQTEKSIKKISAEHERLINQFRAEGKPVFTMVDVKGVHTSDMNAEVRAEMRTMAGRDIDGAALVATGEMASSLMAMAKSAAQGHPVQFFTRLWPAKVWLRDNLKTGWNHPIVALIAAIVIAAIGVLGLIGWGIDNQILRGFLPHDRPINPMAAVGLINVGLIFFTYYRGWLKAHHIFGWLSIALGLAALSPLPVDTILFAHKVVAAGIHTQIADTAAVSFMCVGFCALVSTTRRWSLKVPGYIAVAVLVGLSGFNIYGQLYAHDFIYGISGSFVMAFNLATAFLLAAAAGTLLLFQRHQINLIARVSPLGWLILVALAALQVGGYVYWHQLNTVNTAEASRSFLTQRSRLVDAVNSRITAYSNALNGFQGFYSASDFVSQRDFMTYFNALNLEANYPGLRSVAYIAAASTKDVPALVKQVQRDTSLFPEGNPTFRADSLSNYPVHFFAVYLSNYNQSTQRYNGSDISTIPGREQIYGGALTSGQTRASGTVTFPATAAARSEVGFFIIVPVHTSSSRTPIGVVNANFAYDTFFPKLFDTELADNDLSVQIMDDGNVIYQSASYAADAGSPYQSSVIIPIANRSWTMKVNAGAGFGITADKQRTQIEFIGSLIALSVLLLIMFYVQSRTRRRAVSLANEMTADLQHERRRTMEANQKDEAIITSIGDGLIAFDTEGNVERNNSMAERLFGVVEGGLVGKNLSRLTHAYSLDGVKLNPTERPYAQAIRHKKPIALKVYYERANGTRFPVELNVSPIILNGRVTGAIEVFRDITADLQLDRAKNEFVSLASHQLRTPLSAINWYSEMLLNGDSGALNDEQAAYVKEIFNGNERMIELVNALLDVSRLELGRMTFTPEPIDLHDIITGLAKEFKGTIEAKHMKFITHIDNAVTNVTNDRKMVQMVAQNLMSNAFKYTDPGGQVTVTLRAATADEVAHVHLPVGEPYVLFCVADNGYGIPASQQKRIFEKMFRADNVQTTDVEGTGLGLYIVKEVVLQMGGWIGFESIEKKGSTFTVIVPVTAKEKPLQNPAQNASKTHKP